MSDNPFKLQSDNKQFFTQLASGSLEPILQSEQQYSSGRIKRINQQLEQLAKKRQQMLFKDQQTDFIFKKQQPSIALSDFTKDKDKKYRVRALLKQKKQSIHDFLNKKKQIYLSKMNINIKKQQTSKLKNQIKDQQQTLKARKLYFDNDVQFMHRFIQGIKKQAQDAQNAVQNQIKNQQQLVSKINSLDAQTQKIDNLISKDQQILANLKRYKLFIDSFHKNDRKWKHYTRKNLDQPLYLTQNIQKKQNQDQLIIKFQPQDLLEIFNNAQQNNIRQIQNLHDKQDQLQTITKIQHKQQLQLDKIIKQNQQKLQDLQKKYQKKYTQCIKLRDLKKNNNDNKLSVLDNQDLDLDKVKNKIYQIYKEINLKNNDHRDQKDMKKAMTEIQHQIQKLRDQINKQKQMHPNLIAQIQKQIKQRQKKQNIERKQQQAKQLELKKQKEQEKKRNQSHIQKQKGRKDMRKVLVQKKTQKTKQKEVKVDDDSEKYFIQE